MNKNLDLVAILKDCTSGTPLYSTICGEVTFQGINQDSPFSICTNHGTYTTEGKYFSDRGECVLFPSKEQRDWSKFNNLKSCPFCGKEIKLHTEEKWEKIDEKYEYKRKIIFPNIIKCSSIKGSDESNKDHKKYMDVITKTWNKNNMKKKYLIHYLLQNKEDKFKHIHQSIEIEHSGYIESLVDAQVAVKLNINQILRDWYHIVIVGWQLI